MFYMRLSTFYTRIDQITCTFYITTNFNSVIFLRYAYGMSVFNFLYCPTYSEPADRRWPKILCIRTEIEAASFFSMFCTSCEMRILVLIRTRHKHVHGWLYLT
jgi:hypothetical protein